MLQPERFPAGSLARTWIVQLPVGSFGREIVQPPVETWAATGVFVASCLVLTLFSLVPARVRYFFPILA